MKYIIGLDESGTGPIASLCTIGGFRAPEGWTHPKLRDSKKLSEEQRFTLRDELAALPKDTISYFVVSWTSAQIDELGLAYCLNDGFYKCLLALYQKGDEVIIDGNKKMKNLDSITTNHKSIVKADDLVQQVSAASILAKTTRDEDCNNIHLLHPEYNWKNNKGYLTKDHKEAIKKYGYTDYHRKSYKIKL